MAIQSIQADLQKKQFYLGNTLPGQRPAGNYSRILPIEKQEASPIKLPQSPIPQSPLGQIQPSNYSGISPSIQTDLQEKQFGNYSRILPIEKRKPLSQIQPTTTMTSTYKSPLFSQAGGSKMAYRTEQGEFTPIDYKNIPSFVDLKQPVYQLQAHAFNQMR